MTGETECTVAYGIVLEIQRVIGRKSRFSYKLLRATDYAVARCLSVRPSVTLSVRHTTIFSRNSYKHIAKLFLRQVGTPFQFFLTKRYGNITSYDGDSPNTHNFISLRRVAETKE